MATFSLNIHFLYKLSHKPFYSTTNHPKRPYTSYDSVITKSYKNSSLASIAGKERSVAKVEYQALYNGLRAESIPKHLALLMDDQRRLAKESDLPHEVGYSAGCPSLMDIARICCELGIKVLSICTIYKQFYPPKEGVKVAMSIMDLDIDELSRNDIRVSVIANRNTIPDSQLEIITRVEEATKNNKSLHITETVDYSGRLDMIQACIALAEKVSDGLIQPTEIDDNLFQQELETNYLDFPNPDLMILTGGKYSVDNFMLWQSAYAEICFFEKDALQFNKTDFIEALNVYQKRNRRFGGSDNKASRKI